jgi:hypothetical protein
VVQGDFGSVEELFWAAAIEPVATVPSYGVLRIPGGVQFTMESI